MLLPAAAAVLPPSMPSISTSPSAEAKQFERIRKGILEVSSSEKPYDIFICYKETDEKGDRTLDSVLAQDLYAALTDKGYRVFFSRITLQGKLGEAYEPYIFAALNSAKVMLAVGTCYEYYNAVWVKNEWSRYLKICEADKSKHLIPCYKDLDPEDMPKEVRHLQGADLGKMGAVQDILFNMEKYIPLKKTVKETVVVQQSAETTKVQAMLERAFLFLEDGDWNAANEYCEKTLDIDPKCAEAYLGKLMVDLKVTKREELKNCIEPFDEKTNYVKAIRFADDNLRITLTGIIDSIRFRNENARREDIYHRAKSLMDVASTEESYKEAADMFASISDYKDAATLAEECYEKEEEARKDFLLLAVADLMTGSSIANYEEAIEILETIPGWRNADDMGIACRLKIEELKKEQEIARKKAEESAKQTKRIATIVAALAVVAIAAVLVVTKIVIPADKYDDALEMMENGQYEQALAAFVELSAITKYHAVAEEQIDEARYLIASTLLENGDYLDAAEFFEKDWTYKDSRELADLCYLKEGEKLYADGDYAATVKYLEMAKKHKDSEEIEELLNAAKYAYVLENPNAWNDYSRKYLEELQAIGYKDSTEIVLESVYSGFDDYVDYVQSLK